MPALDAARYTGYLRLTACLRQGRTTLAESIGTGAYKPSRLVEAEGAAGALLYLMNPGGGFVDGDRYRLEIAAEARAELAVTTQSATKVYKTPRDCVRSDTEIRIAAGALVELLPDPVIAYADARYFQRTRICLEPGASVIVADAWTPGWSPSGAPFTYERIDSLTELYLDGELKARDRLALVPSAGGEWDDLDGFTHYGSLLAVHEKADAAAQDKLAQHLAERLEGSGIRFGLTRLDMAGCMLRVMAGSTEQLRLAIDVCHGYIRREWLGKPPLRLRK
ncbi:urease accessory protein UreD [Paenibacillus humicola]|uniref:urease accessory protein UreD n=1 Tax=Paenibacillus humicola TaxID=3110540 RepID=UPI00237A51E9|nr:urease accessory protein UreD [Paenibacillus humicola]